MILMIHSTLIQSTPTTCSSEGLHILLSTCSWMAPKGAKPDAGLPCRRHLRTQGGEHLWCSTVLPTARAGAAEPVRRPPSRDLSIRCMMILPLQLTRSVMQAAGCPSTRRRAPRRSTTTTSRRTSRRSRAWTAIPASRASCSGAGPASTPPRSSPPPTSTRPPPSVRPLPAGAACSQASKCHWDNSF